MLPKINNEYSQQIKPPINNNTISGSFYQAKSDSFNAGRTGFAQQAGVIEKLTSIYGGFSANNGKKLNQVGGGVSGVNSILASAAAISNIG